MTLETLDREGLAETDLPMAELAAALRLPLDWELIPGEAAHLGRLLRAAIRDVEGRSSHALLAREFLVEGTAVGGPEVSIALRPVMAVLAFEAGSRLVPPGDIAVRVRGGRTCLALPFALMAGTPMRLSLRAGYAGWEEVPAALREAVMLIAEGLAGERDEPGRDLVATLLAPFRSMRLRGGALMRRTFTRYLVRHVPVDRPDGAGGTLRGWERRGAFWGEIRIRSARLRVTDVGADPRLRLRITIHSVPEDHPNRPVQGDRFREGGRTYEIEAVHEADRKGRYLACLVHEVVEGGGA